jgi:hypothetical protein
MLLSLKSCPLLCLPDPHHHRPSYPPQSPYRQHLLFSLFDFKMPAGSLANLLGKVRRASRRLFDRRLTAA